MEGIPPTWYAAVWSMIWVLAIPFGILSRFIYSRLTLQPFVWHPTYTMELGMVGCYSYMLYYHILWLPRKNIGMGLDPNPSSDLMYVHEYNAHVSES